MSVFYRYIRPIIFVEERLEVATFPRGGICLRFEEHTNSLYKGLMWFTHARCHNDDLFSKEVAKHIAEARAAEAVKNKHDALGYMGFVPMTKNTEMLAEYVSIWCSEWQAPDHATIAVKRYLRLEQREAGKALDEIIRKNKIAQRTLEVWKESIAAADFKNNYSAQS